jgi:hypothetical protein
MPNESQAQLAKYFVSSTITTCWVGTPENGGAIRMDSICFQDQDSLRAQLSIGFTNAADVSANTFGDNFERRPLPGFSEVPVDRQFRLSIETHERIKE